MLVLDASSSMRGAKLDAAKEAARRFVGALALPRDRVAILRFDAQARLESRITGSAEAALAAIDRVEAGRGTRIDRGLQGAAQALREAAAEGHPNRPIVILLSDGQQHEAAAEARSEAALLRGAGATVYTVGLGAADAALLAEIAGGPTRYRHAESAGALAAIYDALAALVIACVAEDYWGRRCG